MFMSTTALALPLEEAVRTALQTNPDVGIVIENQRAIKAELRQSEAGYYPDVDLNAGLGHEYVNDPSTRADSINNNGRNYTTMNRYESGLTIKQMLFDGYATDSEVARQQSRVVSASRRVRQTSEFVALDAVQAYLESRRQRELTALNEDNVAMHQATLDLVTIKVAGGAATVADQQQAASRLAAAEAALEDAKARLRDADATYSRVIGEAPRELER
ncbi:MAG: TolC family protein, partial [Alphaproteobacteria bacterium]|nr:TolC family protein [Alphaproteobacteria bacterium]